MVNEGLQEVLHTAARGERVTCFMLDNGVFGETGGHMTATTALGQRTKNTLDGRDAEQHGFPIRLSTLIAELDGAAYVARGAVNNAGNVARTKKMIRRALETQEAGLGFSFVEILTMCPTGWFVETGSAPEYLNSTLAPVHVPGVLKDVTTRRERSSSRSRGTPTTRCWRRSASSSPTSRSWPSRTTARSPHHVPDATEELTDDDARGVGRRRCRARPRSPRADRPRSRRICAGCRRSAPASTTSTPPACPTHCTITNAAGVAAAPMAEFVIGRLLQVWKRLPEIDEHQRAHDWKPKFGRTVEGMTLGIIGLGAIGTEVAVRRARAFGMT